MRLCTAIKARATIAVTTLTKDQADVSQRYDQVQSTELQILSESGRSAWSQAWEPSWSGSSQPSRATALQLTARLCTPIPHVTEHCSPTRFLNQRRYGWFFKNRKESTRAERQIGDSCDKQRSAFLEKPGRNRIGIILFIRTVKSACEISGSHAGLNVEKWEGVTGGGGEWVDRAIEMTAR